MRTKNVWVGGGGKQTRADEQDAANKRIAMGGSPHLRAAGVRLRSWLTAAVILAAGALMLMVGSAFVSGYAFATDVVPLLAARTTTGGCTAVNASQFNGLRAVHANGSTSAAAGAAVIEIRGGMASGNVSTVLATLTLTLSTDATAAAGNQGGVLWGNWPFLCANVNSISGTNASVNANVGVD